MSRRITFVGVVRFTDRVLVAGYSPSEADDSLIIKEVGFFPHCFNGCFPPPQSNTERQQVKPHPKNSQTAAAARACCAPPLWPFDTACECHGASWGCRGLRALSDRYTTHRSLRIFLYIDRLGGSRFQVRSRREPSLRLNVAMSRSLWEYWVLSRDWHLRQPSN